MHNYAVKISSTEITILIKFMNIYDVTMMDISEHFLSFHLHSSLNNSYSIVGTSLMLIAVLDT